MHKQFLRQNKKNEIQTSGLDRWKEGRKIRTWSKEMGTLRAD